MPLSANTRGTPVKFQVPAEKLPFLPGAPALPFCHHAYSIRITDRSSMRSDYLRDLRLNRNESQTEFWGRFGVNQRTASRIERGQTIPPTIAILVGLYLDGVIGDADLERAQRRFKIALRATLNKASITEARASLP